MSVQILALLEEHDLACQVKSSLTDCGYNVLLVDSFPKAIALLGAEKVDLIVSDVHLQNGGSVFDFLRLVRKGAKWRACDVPFVLFSYKPTPLAKYLSDGIHTTARCLGASKCIEMETFDSDQFHEQIKGLLSKEDQGPEIPKMQKLYGRETGE